MRTICKWLENILWGRYIRLFVTVFTPLRCNLPQRVHMLSRHNLIHVTTEHEYRKRFWDTGQLGSRVPFLEADEWENANNRPATDYVRKWSKSILDDERVYLWTCMNKSSTQRCLKSGFTLEGFRLARSIATAPPSDWPYKICIVKVIIKRRHVKRKIRTIGFWDNSLSASR